MQAPSSPMWRYTFAISSPQEVSPDACTRYCIFIKHNLNQLFSRGSEFVHGMLLVLERLLIVVLLVVILRNVSESMLFSRLL